mgnify:CR=1 FL=1
MEWVNYVKVICGIVGLVFGFIAVVMYYKMKRQYGLSTDEELEKLMPKLQKESKLITFFFALLVIFTIVSLVLNYVAK